MAAKRVRMCGSVCVCALWPGDAGQAREEEEEEEEKGMASNKTKTPQ